MSINNWLQGICRKEIWDMAGYSSARNELADASGLIQLDANENPYTPYPSTNEFVNANRYPDPQPVSVLSRLAMIYGVSTDKVLVGRGMDEVIDLIIRVFCRPYQDSILITPPTFGYYKVAADISAVKVHEYRLREENAFAVTVKDIVDNVDNTTKIVFLCTPNNPTGNAIDLDTIEGIAKALPNTIIAVDEAYIEFADIDSAVKILDKYSNVLVMKTLSKAYAFAGVRVGTLIAHPEIIKLVQKVLPPYPLPEMCIRAINQALSPFGIDLADSRIKELKAERDRVYSYLTKIPEIKVYPSCANFILFKVDDASIWYKKFLSHGIVIRNRSKDIPNTLRVSIGKPAENDLVLKVFGIDAGKNQQNERKSLVVRKTNETEIMAQVNLDKISPIKISTKIGFFDHMLEQLAKHGGFSLDLQCNGDIHIDYHHTVEDVAIVLGQALHEALGDKKGINRYGFAIPMDEAKASVLIDLSGRGVLVYNVKYDTPLIGDFPVEMVEHFFLSLATHLKAAIHIEASGENAHHIVEGIFKACAKALSLAIQKNNTDSLPSTKGML